MGMTSLGRPYSQYSIAVYKNSFLDKHISSAGWQVWQTTNPQTDNVLFGEYNNFGPGAWTSSSSRVAFATNLTDNQAAAYDLASVFGSTSWIDMEAYNYAPSFNLTRPGPGETTTPEAPANATSVRPTSGAAPPKGAVTVSVGGVQPGSFSSLTAALASLPQDNTNNIGPGNWQNNKDARLAFGNATLATSDAYPLASVMASTSWIDMTHWNSIVTPQPAVVAPPPPVVANTTTPVDGACIVSKTAIAGKTTFDTITGCIASLPATSAVATVFIYPGVYNEKIVFNRSGATVFRGYADKPSDYASNQVTILNAGGVDTQADQSNSDSATFYSRGKNAKFYNINIVNNFGTAQNYASLGFAVANNGFASFYGCQILGNQDTLFINTGK